MTALEVLQKARREIAERGYDFQSYGLRDHQEGKPLCLMGALGIGCGMDHAHFLMWKLERSLTKPEYTVGIMGAVSILCRLTYTNNAADLEFAWAKHASEQQVLDLLDKAIIKAGLQEPHREVQVEPLRKTDPAPEPERQPEPVETPAEPEKVPA